MKLRITDKDLEELTLEQKQNLCDLWIPHAYDVAVASVCVDAAEEKYEQITFVVGGLNITRHNDMILYDMKFMPDELFRKSSAECPACDDSKENPETSIEPEDNSEAPDDALNEDFSEDFSIDDDYSFEFQRPESFNKQECLPLLDIGQMLDILERKNFGECDFSLSVAFGDKTFDMGKSAPVELFSGMSGENSELCDILWLSVKAVL
ncbi:MAG TPA: hypothetical protein VHP38_14820 [Ruminiclostridium sp.]|nr:hypothetical protein [Ruminiclostridium sp.]